MRFVPYAEAADLPNIVVDGAAASATVLTLSHWPKSGTPETLRADTSAEIVFKSLDAPAMHVDVGDVSNNHFDEDGLIGIFALTRPDLAARWRAQLVEIARAGDFGICRSRNAARIAFVLAAYSEQSSSPLPRSTFARPYPEVTARLYEELLPIVPHLITHVEDFQKLWEAEDRALQERRMAARRRYRHDRAEPGPRHRHRSRAGRRVRAACDGASHADAVQPVDCRARHLGRAPIPL